jgi:hypothetical protein
MFVKGQSGNPKGRPKKGELIADQLRILAAKIDVEMPDGTKKARVEALADLMWRKALEGDGFFVKQVNDRLDGLPRQTVDLGGQDDNPLEWVNWTQAERLAYLEKLKSE